MNLSAHPGAALSLSFLPLVVFTFLTSRHQTSQKQGSSRLTNNLRYSTSQVPQRPSRPSWPHRSLPLPMQVPSSEIVIEVPRNSIPIHSRPIDRHVACRSVMHMVAMCVDEELALERVECQAVRADTGEVATEDQDQWL